jgi:transcriptional regulator
MSFGELTKRPAQREDKMFRKDLIPILLDRPMSLSEIARETHEAPKDVIDALEHLSKTLKHSEHQLIIDAAECRNCGFKFRTDKFTRPSKCPECRKRWIAEPLFSIVRK